jgi:putative NADH-flavin reductase
VDQDVVISAVRFVSFDAAQLLQAVRLARTPRLVMVGGAGSLMTTGGVALVDAPGFPKTARSEAEAGARTLQALREQTDVDWTFLSPSAVFAPGERTGRYRIGKDLLLTDTEGKSRISQEDYAIALLDEIESPNHRRERFTVGY